jgi:hypothetical protein
LAFETLPAKRAGGKSRLVSEAWIRDSSNWESIFRRRRSYAGFVETAFASEPTKSALDRLIGASVQLAPWEFLGAGGSSWAEFVFFI